MWNYRNVYKVQQKSTGKIYVAKVSNYNISLFPNRLLYEKREISIFSQFKHPSILKLIGYSPFNFNNEENPVLIMEYCPNLTLSHLIHNERHKISAYNWNETKKLINIYGIASGMSYLHKNGYIHRNLKPSNIFEDEYLFPKIADFGLSKHLENDITRSSMHLKGTALYTPPETFSDNNYYGKAGDVYAFGVILYEILFPGEPPFKGCSFCSIITKVSRGERPTFPDSNNSEAYKDLITRCWAQEEYNRPTFEQIVEELKDQKFMKGVNENEFKNYINYIENKEKSFDPFNKITNEMLLSPYSDNSELNGNGDTISARDVNKETDSEKISQKMEDIEVFDNCLANRNKEDTIREEKVYKNNNLGCIVLVTSELGVFTTIGSMSKMIWELAKELVKIGVNVQVISPYYDKNKKGEHDYLKKYGIKYIQNIYVFVSKPYEIGVHTGNVDGVKCWFLHHPDLFSEPYPLVNNYEKFDIILTLASASLELMFQFFEKMPRLIVTNDWLTGLIPAIARVKFANIFGDILFMHVIHSLEEGYQGKIYTEENEKFLLKMAKGLLGDYIVANETSIIDPSRSALMTSDQWGTISETYRQNLLESSPY